MTTKLIESFGFRSIVDIYNQSWGGFTGLLFADDEIRGEYDVIEFNFDTDFDDDSKYIKSEYLDDTSLDAAYFGRPIHHTIYHFPKVNTIEKQLNHIKNMISSFWIETDKNRFSEPILIISDISETKIKAYYIWEFK